MLMMVSKDFETMKMFDIHTPNPTRPLAYDLEETGDTYVMSFDVPGVHPDDLNIECQGNHLQISGERRDSKKSSRFQQVFVLPEGVQADGIEADLKDGVLRLSIQKPASVKPIKIRIGEGVSRTSFLKNLIDDRKDKDSIEIKRDPVSVAT